MENEPSQNEESKELDRYERIVDWAHKQVLFVRNVYIWLFTCLTAIFLLGVALAVIFIGGNVRDLRDRLNTEMDIVGQQVENQVAEKFNEPEITKIIQKAAKSQADTLMSNQIAPEVSKFKAEVNGNVKQMAKVISEANIALNEIRSTSEFALLVTKASNDDRASFEDLLRIKEVEGHKFQATSDQVLNQIVANLELGTILTYDIDWQKEFNLDPAKASLADFNYVFENKKRPIYQSVVLETIWRQKRFQKPEKLEMLYKVIKTTPSVRNLYTACKLMNEEAKLGKSILVYGLYSEWWEIEKVNYNKKPESQSMDPNK